MISYGQSAIASADFADWATVAAYLLASLLSAQAARHAWLRRKVSENRFWRMTAVLLILLGINELLDLQTLLTMVGRAHAKANDWYGEHNRAQYIFIIALSVAAVITGIALLRIAKQMHFAVSLALAGLVFIGLFVFIRAVSSHYFDELLGRGWPAFNWGSVQEMSGIVIVGAAATLYSWQRPNRGKRPTQK